MKQFFTSLGNLLYGLLLHIIELLKIKRDKKYPMYYQSGQLFGLGVILGAIDIVFSPAFMYLVSLSRDVISHMFWKSLWLLSSFCGSIGAIIVVITIVPFIILVLVAIAKNKFK